MLAQDRCISGDKEGVLRIAIVPLIRSRAFFPCGRKHPLTRVQAKLRSPTIIDQELQTCI